MCARLCVGAFYVVLVNSLYYSYIRRNRNVARGGGREMTYIHLWLIHIDVWQKSNRYCTAIMLQKKKTQQGSQEGMKKSFLTEIYNHNSVYIWEQAAQNHQDFPPASGPSPAPDLPTASDPSSASGPPPAADSPPASGPSLAPDLRQHQALVQHQALLQHQTVPHLRP